MSCLMRRIATAIALGVLAPAAAHAQASIAGVIKDGSGAVLPGVTVEAASPALIEKVRAGVSDGTGQYRIENLRPGTYTVTFTLTGFSISKREGLELVGSMTATVNAELRIGSVQETITVTAESPVVDLQSARREQVLKSDVLTTMPGVRNWNTMVILVPGMATDRNDVLTGPTDSLFSMHGGPSTEGRINLGGMQIGNGAGGGGQSNFLADIGNAEEVTFITSGALGEAEVGGPTMNIVPKVGGNSYKGSFFVNGANSALQGSNYTTALKNAGLTAPNSLIKAYDIDGGVGGPIRKDGLWYFATGRAQGSNTYVTSLYYNRNAGDPNVWTYQPDLNRQAYSDRTWNNAGVRLTWQISPRNKANFYWDQQSICGNCSGATGLNQLPDPLSSPEAQGTGDISPQTTTQWTWSSPVTNRFLFEGGVGTMFYTWGNSERPGNPTHDLIRVTEQCTAGCPVNGSIPGLNYRSMNWNDNHAGAVNWQASASYVTGAHSLKIGHQGAWDSSDTRASVNSTGLTYRVNNGVPNQLTQTISPFSVKNRESHFAVYGQEQWTHKRMTLQGALRYDRAWSWFPATQEGPAPFLPIPLVFDETTGVTGYNDISPRVAAVFDVFGTGKTSVKVNLGKYLQNANTIGNYSGPNPASRIPSNVTRTWVDSNGNFVADCNLQNGAAQNLTASGGDSCGAISNVNFGTTTFSNTYDPAILSGRGVRPNDWNFGASVQQQILPRASVEVGYYVRWFQGFFVTDNLAVTFADFAQFSLTAPLDPRLPGGGGSVITGLYDVNPAQFGLTNNYVTAAESFGDQYSHWDGVEINLTARPRTGLTVQGGTSTGQTVTDSCAIRAQLPEIAQLNPYCHVASGFLTQFRGLVTYTVPKLDIQTSIVLQLKPGPQLAANYTASNAVVAPSLGRNLAAGQASNVTVNLIPPGSLYGDRINQLDLKIGKSLRFGRMRTTFALDVYNALNSDVILIYNNTFIPGGSWLAPQSVISGRLGRISAQVEF